MTLYAIANPIPSTNGVTSGYVLTFDGTGLTWAANGGGGGSGTVTSVSVATANGFSGTVASATTTPAITIIAGAITPTSVNSVVVSGSSTPTLAVTGTTAVSGANTGDQTTSGTSNRITVSTGNTNPVVDIAAAYVGQSSITTLGTIATGVWNAGAITSSGNITGVSFQQNSATSSILQNSGTSTAYGNNVAISIRSSANGRAATLQFYDQANDGYVGIIGNNIVFGMASEGMRLTGANKALLINTTTDDGVNKLQVNGPGTFGTSNAVTLGTIELGAASDTTIARSGAGAITVEGVQVLLSGAALGTPSSGVATNLTGTATGLTSGITNAIASASTTVNVSSATAPAINQVLTATSSTAATWQTLSSMIWGMGFDGTVTISSGTTSLTRPMQYANLTISGTGRLNTQGMPVYVSGTLDISNAPANAISYVTGTTRSASGATAGANGGTSDAPANLSPSAAPPFSGGATTVGTGAAGGLGVGTAAPSTTNSTNFGNGGSGGASGAGGTATAGAVAGGVGVAGAVPNFSSAATPIAFPGTTVANASSRNVDASALRPGFVGGGGGGGGGDGVNLSGAGGGSSMPGGTLFICARIINRGASTTASAISVKPVVGGNGANAAGGNSGGGGGAGGAGGGWIALWYDSLTGSSATNCIDASGGTAGNGGNGVGTGAGGVGGTGGRSGYIQIISPAGISLSTWNVAGSAPGAPSGTTGGTGGAGAALSVSL